MVFRICTLTHSLTHSPTHSLTHSLTYSLTHSLTHSYGSNIYTPLSSAYYVLRHKMCSFVICTQVDADTEEQWTYAELKRIVRSIGSALSRRGLRKGDVVATCAPNVMEHAAILLAVPAIGGIPSGMNPLYTPGTCTSPIFCLF